MQPEDHVHHAAIERVLVHEVAGTGVEREQRGRFGCIDGLAQHHEPCVGLFRVA
jgi:hypothetical protein